MQTDMVSLSQAGAGAPDVAAGLNKALTAGFPNLPGSTGSALVPQALDPVITNLQFQDADLAMINSLERVTVPSTVAQYAELTSYGQPPLDNGYIDEVDVPQESSASYAQRYTALKQLAFQGGVSFTLMQTGSIVEPLAQETMTLAKHMLRAAENGILYGNSALSPKQIDGFIPQMLARSPKECIRDLRGLPITTDEVVRATGVVKGQYYGKLSHLVLNTMCKADLNRSQLAIQRNIVSSADQAGIILGLDAEGVRGSNGVVKLVDSPFITDGGSPTVTVSGNTARVPAAPVVTAVAAAAPANGQVSQFTTQQDEGDVSYVIQACNRYGRSAPVFFTPGATVAVQDGQVVNATITPGAGVLPEYYRVFRTPTNSGSLLIEDHKQILQVPNCDGNGTPRNVVIQVTDTNAKLPGTFDAIAFDMSPGVNRIVQTAPITRYPMGIQATAFQFMLTWTHGVQMRAPGRMFLWQNVGRSSEIPLVR